MVLTSFIFNVQNTPRTSTAPDTNTMSGRDPVPPPWMPCGIQNDDDREECPFDRAGCANHDPQHCGEWRHPSRGDGPDVHTCRQAEAAHGAISSQGDWNRQQRTYMLSAQMREARWNYFNRYHHGGGRGGDQPSRRPPSVKPAHWQAKRRRRRRKKVVTPPSRTGLRKPPNIKVMRARAKGKKVIENLIEKFKGLSIHDAETAEQTRMRKTVLTIYRIYRNRFKMTLQEAQAALRKALLNCDCDVDTTVWAVECMEGFYRSSQR